MSNDDKLIKFSQSTYCPSRRRVLQYVACDCLEWPWGAFKYPHRIPLVGYLEQDEYFRYLKSDDPSLKQQALDEKALNGWEVPGHFPLYDPTKADPKKGPITVRKKPYGGPYRKKKGQHSVPYIVLDIEGGTLPFYEKLLGGKLLRDVEWFLFTTRSHRAIAPRVRMYILLEHAVDPDIAEYIARIYAHKLDPTMTHIDPKSFNISQLMYRPVVAPDAQDEFIFIENPGRAVNALGEFHMYMVEHDDDLAQIPRCPENDGGPSVVRSVRSGGGSASSGSGGSESWAELQLASEKPGLIGAYNRARPMLVTVVREDLPYVLPDRGGRGFIPGKAGADGLMFDHASDRLFSFYANDPISGHGYCTPFDVMRLNRFAELDEAVAPDTPIQDLPSQKAALAYARTLTDVRSELFRDWSETLNA